MRSWPTFCRGFSRRTCRARPWAAAAFRRSGRLIGVLALAATLSGCAMFISDPEERAEVMEANDPIEGVNRHIFAVNLALDTFLLRPVAFVYREFMPPPGQNMVRNFVHNLKLPFTALNDLAQGEPDRAQTAMSRFLVNTTVGMGGLFDAATGLGLDYHEEDFGQTLAVYGSEEGPYLMLPIFGPSSLRDAIGLVVQYFTDPVGIGANEAGADNFGLITGGMEAVDTRARHFEAFDNLQRQSLDFYAAVRSLYRQRREAEIRNSESDAVPSQPLAEARPDNGGPPPEQLAGLGTNEEASSPEPGEPAAREAPAEESGPAPRSPQADAAIEPLDRTAAHHISVAEHGAPASGRSDTGTASSPKVATLGAHQGRADPFAEALRAFEGAARSFDAIAGSASNTR